MGQKVDLNKWKKMPYFLSEKNQYQKDMSFLQVKIYRLNVIPRKISKLLFFFSGARQVNYKVILENKYKTSQESPPIPKTQQWGTSPTPH